MAKSHVLPLLLALATIFIICTSMSTLDAATAAAPAPGSGGCAPGGGSGGGNWVPVSNVNASDVQGMGVFAVREINRRPYWRYLFVRVTEAEFLGGSGCTSGTTFRLVISVREYGILLRTLQATVYKTFKDNSLTFVSYQLLQ